MTSPAAPLKIIILGGGIAGLTLALALTKFSPPNATPDITIFEVRPELATIGGAVNLTPNALRLLDHLGALSVMKERGYGKEINAVEIFDIYSYKLGESAFRGPTGDGIGNPPYKALRITRGDSLKAVIAAIETHPNIKIQCGKKTTQITETASSVTLTFTDKSSATADLLIGCDGIHSFTRLGHVEPSRAATYSGIANAFGFAPRPKDLAPHFENAAMHFARRGMLLTSFFEPSCASVYVGALIEVPEVADRDGWKAVAKDEVKVKADIKARFGDGALPFVDRVIDTVEDLYLWPVFTLSKGGKWCTDRVMLLGDAAHAMPPQGESTGIVFEDAVLFARCVARWQEMDVSGSPIRDAFMAYENLRRARIDSAFEESKSVVNVVKDAGWLGHKIKTYVVPWFLWWTRTNREKHFIEDVTTSNLGF